jgi:hypothetical protein
MDEIEVEIEIDLETGEILLSRDHDFVVEIAKEINPEDRDVISFVEDKPKTIDGDVNYKSFCG